MKPCMAMEQVDCYHYLAIGELTMSIIFWADHIILYVGNPLCLVESFMHGLQCSVSTYL